MILSVTSALLPGLMISHESPSWGGSTQATNDSNLHFTPSVAQDPSGNVYLFWDQNPGIHYLVTSTANINSTSSTTPTLFTKNNQFDVSPSALALSNGTLMLFWAGQRNGFWDIYVSRYNSGVWSTAAPVTPTLAQDKHPATMQDSTGKIWVSWAQSDTGDLGIKFVDSNSNRAWDTGETMVYDSDLNGLYNAGRYHNDTLIRGQAPANNTALTNDPKLSFSDSNGNGRWDIGEFIVYDQNLDNTFDPKLRYVDSNTNNVWDQGEAVIWDADANGTYTSHGGTAGCTSASIAFNRDCIIAGPFPGNGTATKIDLGIKFFDSSGNGVWDLGETVIYDRNLNGLYDSSDTVISAAFSSDPMIKFQDLNSNNIWDPGEPVAYDSNNNNVYDSKIKFVDSNNNGKWNAGEAIVYDADNNGQYSEFIDTLIAGPTPNTGQALKNDAAIRFVDGNANGAWDYGEAVVYDSNLNSLYDGNLRFVDSNNNGIWNPGESVVSDTDLNGIYTQGTYHNDTLVAGAAPLNNTILKQDPLVRLTDTNFNQAWNQGEVVVYDTNNNHKYDTGEQVIAGSTPSVGTGLTTGIGEALISPGSPATGASLTNDSKIKYVDGNSNNVWDPGESIVYDVNSTSLYALGDPILNGTMPSVGTALKLDPLMRFGDANGNALYDSAEALVYDQNNNHLFDVLEFVIIGSTPGSNSSALTSGELVIAGSLRAGTSLKSDSKIKFVDNNGNHVWDQNEPAVYDSNNNGLYDTGDITIAGSPAPPIGAQLTSDETVLYGSTIPLQSALRTDAKLKFVDSNNNLVWDVGETVVYDANSNGQYDQADPVISGPVPAVGTILRTDVKLSYVDCNADSLWEIGEPVVYDSNANGSYDSVEPLIATFIAPSVNSTLKTDSKIKFFDANADNIWELGEQVIYDSNNNGVYDANEGVISGAAPAVGATIKSDAKIKFVDLKGGTSVWSLGDPLIYDSNINNKYDLTDPVIASGPLLTGSPLKTNMHIFYESTIGTGWQPEQRLTTQLSDDHVQSLFETRDGRKWIVWAGDRGGISKILYRTTLDGVTWTPEQILASSSIGDTSPSGIQDRNGTIWIAWTRHVPCGCGPASFQDDIYYMYSVNNGATWSAPAALTSTTGIDEQTPTIHQLSDKKLYVYYEALNCGTSCLGNLYFSATVINMHDANLNGVPATNSTSVRARQTLRFTANVSNVGDFNDNLIVTITANGTQVATNSSTVSMGQSKLVIVNWLTLGVHPGHYLVTVTVTVPGEGLVNTVDNSATLTVLVRPAGDVNGDCLVDVNDLVLVASAYGKTSATPGFNPQTDLNNSGAIDVADLAIAAGSYNQHC